MLDTRHQDLVKHGDKLFADRMGLVGWWQESSDHFYPERGNFIVSPTLGRDFAAHLTTSYPIIARRDLGNAFGAMLRPRGKSWFSMKSMYSNDDDDGLRWYAKAALIQRRAMYDRASQFVRATKEGDHDFATFGQTVISVELNRFKTSLLYRCWHLRDVVWWEDSDGDIGGVQRNWEPTLREAIATFGENNLSPKLVEKCGKEPFSTVKLRHIVIKSTDYDPPAGQKGWKQPYVSIFLDLDNAVMIEETGIWTKYYVIPRWQTVSGSQYAHSPAVVCACPDARLIQGITLTLLQAGERAADPPALAQQGVIKGDVDLRSGGVTWADAEYDERLGAALQLMPSDKAGLQFGIEMRNDAREMIAEAFYLNKLGLPPADREMTAYEAGQRVQEYIRQALPLFEPMEDNYNGALCEETFTLMMHNNAFGPPDTIPQSLRGAEVQFHFESPLQKAEDTEKGAIFQNGAALLAAAVQVDPGAAKIVDVKTALRDALYGIGTPPDWLRTQDQVAVIEQQDAAKQQAAESMQALQQGAMAAESFGNAAKSVKEAGLAQAA